MNTDLYLSFLLLAVIFIVIPGPNVWLIVCTSVAKGRRQGFETVLGTSIAMSIQLLIAAMGSVWLIHFLAESFIWLKWVGVVYLAYMGVQSIRVALGNSERDIDHSRGFGNFSRGFIVSLTNPKTIIFFAAFLPQFVDESLAIATQMMLLAVSFLIIAIVFDSLYVVFASSLREYLPALIYGRRGKFLNGGLLLSLSAALAVSRQAE